MAVLDYHHRIVIQINLIEAEGGGQVDHVLHGKLGLALGDRYIAGAEATSVQVRRDGVPLASHPPQHWVQFVMVPAAASEDDDQRHSAALVAELLEG